MSIKPTLNSVPVPNSAPWFKHEGKLGASYSAEASELSIRPGAHVPDFECVECSGKIPPSAFIPQKREGEITHYNGSCSCGTKYTIWND